MVLVVRHGGLGDLLTAVPAMRALRRRYPRERLVTTCPTTLLPLARQLGFADNYITESSRSGSCATQHVDTDHEVIRSVLAWGGDQRSSLPCACRSGQTLWRDWCGWRLQY
jgi:hypothetical protein